MIFTKTEFLTRSKLQIKTLELWIEHEWVIPQGSADGSIFSEADLARVHFIRELADKVGANDAGIDVILHLLDQLHGMRRAFEQLQSEMRTVKS